MKVLIKQYLDTLCYPYTNNDILKAYKEETLTTLYQRYDQFVKEYTDKHIALSKTLLMIEEIEKALGERFGLKASKESHASRTFQASSLMHEDFSNISLPNIRFKHSNLQHASFAHSDLTSSILHTCEMQAANFTNAKIVDCTLKTTFLQNAHFQESMILHTTFHQAALDEARFEHTIIKNSTFSMVDFRNVKFQNCIFDGVTLQNVDFRDMCLDAIVFKNLVFRKVSLRDTSFQNAVLLNVSFQPPFSITNTYYKEIKSVKFQGTLMDKLTYHSLKGLGVDVSEVSIIE